MLVSGSLKLTNKRGASILRSKSRGERPGGRESGREQGGDPMPLVAWGAAARRLGSWLVSSSDNVTGSDTSEKLCDVANSWPAFGSARSAGSLSAIRRQRLRDLRFQFLLVRHDGEAAKGSPACSTRFALRCWRVRASRWQRSLGNSVRNRLDWPLWSSGSSRKVGSERPAAGNYFPETAAALESASS